MVLLDETAVRKAFRTRLLATPNLPTKEKLAWENRPFTPPSVPPSAPDTGSLWVREWQSIDTERKSATGVIEATGTTRYAVYAPRSSGTEAMDTLVRSIAGQFEAGQSLTATDLRVILERTFRSEVRVAPDHDAWVFKVVTIRWRVFTRSSTSP